ncbi:glycosyltransferase [Sphingobacterium sp.]|uniref:glycosyltransferase family 2 protein n=1 Tax=Sphingobacterium sp. TaxID=341027 RepID=UPI002896F948|nr:glycosyltransferase [Sphingobacterium sp.]
MFSVVIPLYNKEKQIQKTLDSVLNQTFTDFEIVIVNDGSIDRSVEIVKSVNDPRIRLINQKNGGVSAARNRGVKEAKNKWIAFLDADDLWKKNKLETYANIINTKTDISWIISGYNSIRGNNRINYVYSHNGPFIDGLDDLNNGLSIQTSTVVVPRDYFINDDKLFFKEGINNSEDREVWIRLLFRYPNAYYIQEALTEYLIDLSGQSLNTSNDNNYSFLDLERRLEDDFTNLTEERKLKITIALSKFNRKALWRKWVKRGWDSKFQKHLSDKDIKLMKIFSSFPMIIRKIVLKIFIR